MILLGYATGPTPMSSRLHRTKLYYLLQSARGYGFEIRQAPVRYSGPDCVHAESIRVSPGPLHHQG